MDAGEWFSDSRFLIVCFTAGVLGVHALAELPPPALLAIAALPALWPWRWRLPYAFLILGVLLACWRGQMLLDARWPAARHGEELSVRGRVVSLPEEHAEAATSRREAGTTWRFLFEPADARLDGRVRVSWYRTQERVAGAQCWVLRLKLRTPRGSLNPGGFDYEGWLFRQGIIATATVRDAEPCTDVDGLPVLRWRQQLRDRLQAALGDHPASGLLVALALGDDSGLTDADWDLFRVTGTSHLVAISGLNLAVVAGFVFFLARWAWSASAGLCRRMAAQKVAMIVAALFATGYALLAGFEPPVVRALLMLLVVMAAIALDRLGQMSRALALAWFAILLADPFAILSPGLWLSFGAVAAIGYLAGGRREPPGVMAGAVKLQLALGVALAPLSVWFFHGLAWAAPLVNLAAVPWFTLLTPVVLGAVLAIAVAPDLGASIVLGVAELLRLTLELLAALVTAFPQPWIASGPAPAALLLGMGGTVLLFAPRGLPVRMLGLLCLLPLAWPPANAPERGFELAVLDVGQGLAVVVRTPHHTLLYDAGPAFDEGFDAGESVVAPYLLEDGVSRLDVLMLSHPDNDHGGGVPAVRSRLAVRREIGTARAPPCRDGEEWTWDGVRFRTLHPDGAAWPDNDGSCVLRIDGPHMSALLTGDIERGAELRLLRDHPADLKADVLIAPHHGSKTSSGPGFVAAVAPRLAIFSAAWRGHYGHPRAEVVDRYRMLGAATPVTGHGGALSIKSGVAGPEWSGYRTTGRHFWHAPAGE